MAYINSSVMILASDVLPPVFFFFQAEDGIRDLIVTGVQTCALPISPLAIAPIAVAAAVARSRAERLGRQLLLEHSLRQLGVRFAARQLHHLSQEEQIGRASCRERV